MTAQMVAQQTVGTVEPHIAFLASALKMQLADNPAGQRAVDRAVEQLAGDPVYEFDGVELRILSHSRTSSGIWHITDGVACTCESGRREWCRHRAIFRLKMAEAALMQPALLRAKILEQCEPIEMPDSFLDSLNERAFDDYGDIIAPARPAPRPTFTEPYRPRIREMVPPAGSDWARSQAEADELFAA